VPVPPARLVPALAAAAAAFTPPLGVFIPFVRVDFLVARRLFDVV